jgi:hypothetical protein
MPHISGSVADSVILEAVNILLEGYGPESQIGGLVKSLGVMLLTPGIRAHLLETDPQAYKQAVSALERAALPIFESRKAVR